MSTFSTEPALTAGEQQPAEKAVGVTAIVTSTGAIAACAACCVLPIAFPAIALAGFGGALAWFAGAQLWITAVAVVVVTAAWAWIGLKTRRTGKKAARQTIAMMVAATGMLVLALLWTVLHRGHRAWPW